MCRFISRSKHALSILCVVLLAAVQFRGIANAQPVLTDQELGAFAGVYRYDKESIRQMYSDLLDSGEVDELNTAAQKWGRTKLLDELVKRDTFEVLVWPRLAESDPSTVIICIKWRKGLTKNKKIKWRYPDPVACMSVYPIPANLDCPDDQLCFMTEANEAEWLWRFNPDFQSLTWSLRKPSETWKTERLSRKSAPDYDQWLAQPDVKEVLGVLVSDAPTKYTVGTGVSINPNFVVTAAHVIRDDTKQCKKAFVFDASWNRRFKAEVFATSPFLDLAVLRVSDAMEHSAAKT
jgi:hypothetical protein